MHVHPGEEAGGLHHGVDVLGVPELRGHFPAGDELPGGSAGRDRRSEPRNREVRMADKQPVVTMAIAAVGLHELYESYVKAGFSEEQAFELVKVALALVCQQGRPTR